MYLPFTTLFQETMQEYKHFPFLIHFTPHTFMPLFHTNSFVTLIWTNPSSPHLVPFAHPHPLQLFQATCLHLHSMRCPLRHTFDSSPRPSTRQAKRNIQQVYHQQCTRLSLTIPLVRLPLYIHLQPF